MNDKQNTDHTVLEAQAFRRLISHLQQRNDVQNIDLMNLAGFCRNCLANWYFEAAQSHQKPVSKQEAKKIIYGMAYDEWKSLNQTQANPEQQAHFEQRNKQDK